MPTISAKVNQKELDAICEYANQCGETVSNLIRKTLIKEATFLDGGFENDCKDYDCKMNLSTSRLENEEQLIEQNYNKIRSILGLKQIKLS
jgi:hypothetical protein